MPILSPKELELIREKRRTEGGAMPPSSVNEATSKEWIEKDVMNRILNPDGGLDLATKRAMKSNEGNPSFQIPASGIKSREMKLAENAARDPNLFRSLAGGLTVDPFRRKAREWRFLQEQEDAIDSGVFGRAEDVRRLQQAGLSLEKIGERAVLKGYFQFNGFPRRFSGDALCNLTVRVPKTIDLAVDDGSGSMAVVNIRGDVSIEDGSGDITVRGVEGDVRVDDGSGDIDIRDVTGGLRIDDGSGSMTITGIGGSVTVDDGSGDIEIDAVGGDVILESTGSGGVSIGFVRGRVIR